MGVSITNFEGANKTYDSAIGKIYAPEKLPRSESVPYMVKDAKQTGPGDGVRLEASIYTAVYK